MITIWSGSTFQGLGCSPIKVVRELGSERRETVRSLSVAYNTLTNFTASLPEGRFARIHRSYTVSVDKIDAIEGNTVEIMTTRLPFSRKYIAENQLKVFK